MKNFVIITCLIATSILTYADTYHPGDITSNETWNASDSPHIITANIDVINGVILTIEPGSIVKFGGNLRLVVYGTLLANGTSGAHIIFEADETALGDDHWMNINFSIADGINILNYCDISKGGSSYGNIIVSGGSDLTISNCNIQNSATNGISLLNYSDPLISNCNITNNLNHGIDLTDSEPDIIDCTISSNGQYGIFVNDIYGNLTVSGGSILNNSGPAIRISASDVKNITGVTILGNNPDKIEVLGEQIGDATWDQEVAFIILSTVTVQGGSTLSLAPGTACQFETNAGLNIYGALDANGTELLQNVFTSAKANPSNGDWKYIYFQTGEVCTLNFCNIYFGGSSNGNVYVRSGSNITISNCVMQNSGSNGIYLYDNASPTIDNCIVSNNNNFGIFSNTGNCYPGISLGTISDNGGPAVRLSPGAINNFDGVLMYGNNPDEIQVVGGTFYSNTVWDDPFPYKILGNLTVNSGVTFTLAPGVVVKFDGNFYLWINGVLDAIGTSVDPITFTSSQASPTNGYWKYIYFQVTSSSNLNYCDIYYGGSSNGSLNLNLSNNINISNCNIKYSGNDGIYLYKSSPDIIHCDVSENDNQGINATNACYPVLINNQITDNLVNGIMIQGGSKPVFGSDISEWNDIYGNANYDVYNNTNLNMDVQYVYWGTLDQVQISTAIYDQNENPIKGVVTFNPWTNAGHNALFPNAGFDFDLKVFLEGPFNGTNMSTNLNPDHLPLSQPFNVAPWNYAGTEAVVAIPNGDITDWILLELRDAPDPASATSGTMISQQAVFLKKDGTIVGVDGSFMPSSMVSISEQLYVVVWHRNHLGIVSSSEVTESGGVYAYDFSTAASQAYGTNAQKNLGGGIYGMIAADANADGEVNLADKTLWETEAGEAGYYLTDFDMNGEVNNLDKDELYYLNDAESCQVPD